VSGKILGGWHRKESALSIGTNGVRRLLRDTQILCSLPPWTIVPEVQLTGSTILSLQRTSTSQFNWPTQPAPGKSAWSLWTKTIKKLYVKPGMSTQLKKPLGPWYPQASEVRRWYTTYNLDTKTVLVHAPHQPPTKFPIQSTMQTHNYYTQAQPTNAPPAASYPITLELQ